MLASHRRMPLLRRLLSLRGADVDAVLYSELRALLALPVSLAEAASPLAQRGTAPSVLSPSAALLQNEATRREGAISVAPSAVTRAESLDARRVNSNGDAGNDESPCGRADPSRLRGDHSKRVDFSSAAPAAPAEKEEHAAWPWTSCPRAPAEGECGERRGREQPQHPEAAADAYDGRRLGAGATHARANEDDRHRSDSGSTGVQAGRRHVAMKGHTAEEGDALLACLLDAVEYAAGLCGAKVSAAKHSAPQAPPREPATESGGDPRGAQSADASFVSSPFSVSPFPSAASCLSTRPPHASSCSCSCLRRASAPSAVRWAPAASHPSPTGSCPSEANLVASPTGFPSRVSSPAASSSSLLFEASSGQQAWSGNASISPPTAAPSSSVGVCRLAAPSLTRALSARRYSQPIFRATWAPEAEFERRQQHVVTRVSRLKEKISRLANAMSRELPWSEGCATWDEAHARRAASCSPQRQRADSPFAAPQMEAHLPFASPSESFALSAAFTDSPVAAPWRLVARPHAMSPSPWPASSPWLLPRIQFEAAVATPPFAPRAGATSPAFPPEAADAKTDELRLREWRCWDAGEPYAGNATDTKACEGEGTSAETEREQRQRGRQRHNRGTSAWPPPRRIADCEWTGGDGARTTSPASESSFSVLPRSAKIVERLTDLRLAQGTRRSDKGESASGLAELERSPEQKVPRCASPGSSPTGILSLHQGLPKDAPTDASSLGQTAVDGSFAGDAVALWKLPEPDKSSPREGRQPRMRASVNDGSSAGSCMRERECLNTEKQSQNGQQRISAESEPHACGGRDAASKSVASRSGRQGEICQERDTGANANDLFSQPGGGGPQHELTPSAGKNAEETNAKQCCKSQHEEPAGTTTHAGACNEDNASLAISPLGSGSDLHQRRARLVRQEARLSLVAKKIQILQTSAETACSEACLRSILEEQLALLREQHEAAREEKPVKRP
ncbi:hypothetical protein BESB_044390 [Besnoitia besnoiti]|uniref:Uncharacterized protein n=1 Tax=Besnoitia besnoiti TaxID=94643 RepID=A0A2A9MKU3_BESBE|nr:hypothetical protein BESB_044390 [Besnoitia besnoiti]PFH36247.1 hypothetical protein BESB_044390 [Besnoitia besnoiti]